MHLDAYRRTPKNTRVGLLTGRENAAAVEQRRAGFEQAIKELGGIEVSWTETCDDGVQAYQLSLIHIYSKSGHTSVAQIEGMKERTVFVGGFSKTYAMTGWRLGYLCGPAPLVSAMTKLHQYAIMSAPTTAQYAAVEAIRNGDEDIVHMREEYDLSLIHI